MNFDIAFLSKIIPKEIESQVRSNMINHMEDAAIAWQNHLIEGIEAAAEVPIKLINVLPINPFPAQYKKPIIHKFAFSHTKGANDISIGHCNIHYIKKFALWSPLKKELKKWAETEGPQKVLIAYTMHPDFLEAIKWVKINYPHIITLNVVVDMPEFTTLGSERRKLISKIYAKLNSDKAKECVKYTDGFVAITKQMAAVLSPNTPYTIIEGMCSNEFSAIKATPSEKKSIIYAGMLYEKFGIVNLLDSFAQLKQDDVELKICGIGDLDNEIKTRANKDHRIKYFGQLKRDEVLLKLLESSIIINPRQNLEEFTKYSFPSKNMEALSTGIPFVGYKLDGIPDEYDNFINYPKDNSVESLSKLLNEIMENYDKYKLKAAKAKEWVYREKSVNSQGKKIVGLINKIKDNQETDK